MWHSASLWHCMRTDQARGAIVCVGAEAIEVTAACILVGVLAIGDTWVCTRGRGLGRTGRWRRPAA
jgi:hypothetical protein